MPEGFNDKITINGAELDAPKNAKVIASFKLDDTEKKYLFYCAGEQDNGLEIVAGSEVIDGVLYSIPETEWPASIEAIKSMILNTGNPEIVGFSSMLTTGGEIYCNKLGLTKEQVGSLSAILIANQKQNIEVNIQSEVIPAEEIQESVEYQPIQDTNMASSFTLEPVENVTESTTEYSAKADEIQNSENELTVVINSMIDKKLKPLELKIDEISAEIYELSNALAIAVAQSNSTNLITNYAPVQETVLQSQMQPENVGTYTLTPETAQQEYSVAA